MEYRTLGSTGTIVSAQCLGTMTFGRESDEETAYAQLDLFVERGGNFVDTADVYAGGRSEEIIGRWLAARSGTRDRLVIATKGRFPMGDGHNDYGLSRSHLGRALDASLRRLGVDVGRGVPMSRVALAWVADRPAVTSVIVGARTVAQLDDNLAAAGLHLSAEETELLDDASAPLVADYPYGTPGIDQRSRPLG